MGCFPLATAVDECGPECTNGLRLRLAHSGFMEPFVDGPFKPSECLLVTASQPFAPASTTYLARTRHSLSPSQAARATRKTAIPASKKGTVHALS